jgi:hypothetical protein
LWERRLGVSIQPTLYSNKIETLWSLVGLQPANPLGAPYVIY